MAKFRGSKRRPASVLVRVIFWIVLLVFLAPALVALALRIFAGQPHWGDASHATTGQAPRPDAWRPAVVQVYAARTWGARGAIGVHTWIAAKRGGADHYRRYEVIGWYLRRGNTAVVNHRGTPDAMWFSNKPRLLTDLRGDGVERVIDKIEQAVERYPYANEYRMWPGPNSNTFVAFVARQVPELRLELPPTAIGKDYLGRRLAQVGAATDGGRLANGANQLSPSGANESSRLLAALAGPAPSGTGFQISLFGAAGILVARREGIELNFLGLVAGVRPWPLAIKLPGLGTLPAADAYRDWQLDDG